VAELWPASLLEMLTLTQRWVPGASRDFNGDGRADLLWYNSSNGAIGVWFLDGLRLIGTAATGVAHPSTGWVPMAAEDFNGDGHADILWVNSFDGNVVAWLLHAGQLAQTPAYGTVPATSGWTLAGLDDYNGDGRTDLFWSNAFNDATSTWLIGGATVIARTSYGTLPRSALWQAQIPR
jgi:hypothetical protein